MYTPPRRVNASVFRGKNPRKLSKKDIKRIENGLEPVPLEDTEAEWLTKSLYLRLRKSDDGTTPGLLWFSHIPNETRTTRSVAAKLKLMWVRRGKSDYELIVRLGPGSVVIINIELKKSDLTASAVTPDQKKYIEYSSMVPGVFSTASFGHRQALEYLEKITGLRFPSILDM